MKANAERRPVQWRGHAPLYIIRYTVHCRCLMVGDPQPQKIPLIFYRTEAGSEPVREWLKGLKELEP